MRPAVRNPSWYASLDPIPADLTPYEADGADARAHGYALERNPYVWSSERGEELACNAAKREAWARGWTAADTATRAILHVQCSHGDLLGTFLRTAEGVLVSPVYEDSARLYAWAKANGWRGEDGKRLTADYVKAA